MLCSHVTSTYSFLTITCLLQNQNIITAEKQTKFYIYMANKKRKYVETSWHEFFFVLYNFLQRFNVLRTIIVEVDALFVTTPGLVKVTSFQRANQTRPTQKIAADTIWINLSHRRQCQWLARLLVPKPKLRLTSIYAINMESGARTAVIGEQESEYVFFSHTPSYEGQTETKRSHLIGIVEVLNFCTIIITFKLKVNNLSTLSAATFCQLIFFLDKFIKINSPWFHNSL